MVPLLVGEYDFTLDAKNRVAIPARLRPAFADGLYVTRGHERCLAVYSQDEFREHLRRCSQGVSAFSSKGRALQRFATAGAVFQTLDGQGRVTLSARQLAFAAIAREVTIIGVEDHLEIWERASWADYLARLEEEADATADELAAS